MAEFMIVLNTIDGNYKSVEVIGDDKMKKVARIAWTETENRGEHVHKKTTIYFSDENVPLGGARR